MILPPTACDAAALTFVQTVSPDLPLRPPQRVSLTPLLNLSSLREDIPDSFRSFALSCPLAQDIYFNPNSSHSSSACCLFSNGAELLGCGSPPHSASRSATRLRAASKCEGTHEIHASSPAIPFP